MPHGAAESANHLDGSTVVLQQARRQWRMACAAAVTAPIRRHCRVRRTRPELGRTDNTNWDLGPIRVEVVQDAEVSPGGHVLTEERGRVRAAGEPRLSRTTAASGVPLGRTCFGAPIGPQDNQVEHQHGG